jgi:hypothetical protein
MSEVETELDAQMADVQMDLPELDPNAPIVDLIQAINRKDYNNAEDLFKGALDSKISDQLDQARARIAGQMYNGDEIEAAIDEVEAEAELEDEEDNAPETD